MASTHFPTLRWNGACFEPSEGGVPVSDRGVRYGMALFESFAVRGGRVEAASAHLDQLAASCRALGWPFPEAALAAVPGAMLEAFGPGPVFARLYMTAGDGGPLDPVGAPRLFLFGEERHAPVPRSFRLVTLAEKGAAFTLPGLSAFGGLKSANYWGAIAALAQARAAGGEEGVRLNAAGEAFSACMANLFVVLDGELLTPAPESGARRGTVRQWVLERRRVREVRLGRPELEAATECFLTSTWNGIVPASHLNSRALATTMGEALRHEWAAALS